MDEIVQAAMKKWPDVPAVFHWLSLDGRGRWRLKGEVVSNTTMIAFLNRNYDHDGNGRWSYKTGHSACLSRWKPHHGSFILKMLCW